ncbi:hypothetical protein [Phytohabitans rumicis]|uniref:Uncharacterized protein n=1 Tax=Phytohabitans rumicis TaxID=1076125 RepID=A0A6V8LD18_9ACTN|nr:hypothetical protein [Phytohabitans rumicis]GFJ92489.1 hypothetical protein Prum_061310 [Phytohabitans rumicis]
MAWYLAPSLAVLRTEVNTRWPRRDKTSDGTIGDPAHQERPSDHNPNARESVDAWDMDKDGVDVDEVIRAFERHPSAHYWIWNRQLADKDTGWRPEPYDGDNAHTLHVHFSIKQTAAAEQDRRPWGLLEDDMNFRDGGDGEALIYRLSALVSGAATVQGGPTKGERVAIIERINSTVGRLDALAARVEALAAADAARDAQLRALLEQHEHGQLSAEAVVRRMGELLAAAGQDGA